MPYKLFIDDERFPPRDGEMWDVVRTSCDAVLHVALHGMPRHISFDHDLGGTDTSMKFIDWLIEAILDGHVQIPKDFSYYVHSQNPVGAQNIKYKMDALVEYARDVQ